MKIRNVGFYWLLLMAVLSMSWCHFSLAQDAEVDAKKAKPLSKKVLQTVGGKRAKERGRSGRSSLIELT